MKRVNLEERRPQRPTDPPKHRLLYVEDDDSNWQVAEVRLRHKYQMTRARDDREACRLLTDIGSDLYAILMDIELKGSKLSGIELTQLVRGKIPQGELPPYARDVPVLSTPIIFMTAYATAFPESELLASGASHRITKPVNFVTLNLALARIHTRAVLGPP